jgi:hypothetical protein
MSEIDFTLYTMPIVLISALALATIIWKAKKKSAAVGSTMENAGIWIYEKINNSRILIGVLALIILTAISMRLNYIQGLWTANDPESEMLLPAGYATLDASLIFFLAMLVIGIHSKLLRGLTVVWCIVLMSLSLWSSFSFTVAVDERGTESAISDRIEQLKDNLVTEKKTVETWQDKLDKTSWLSSSHGAKLSNAQLKRDATQSEINSLNISNTPAALAVFDKVENMIGGGIASETLRLIVRFIWSNAIVITPLLMVLVLASEMKRSFGQKKKIK